MKNEEWAAQTERRAELARAMLRCSQTSTIVNGLRESCGRGNRMAILHSSFK